MSETAKKEITTAEAVKALSSALASDKGFWFAWQSAIAVNFQDECARSGVSFPDLHKISNQAADNFLKMLTNRQQG